MRAWLRWLRENALPIILAALLLGTLFIWYAVYVESSRDRLTVAFLNVGQGDSIFIEAPNGKQILIDGGPDRSVLRELGKVMPFYDRSLDAILVTNPDRDHYAGFIDVLRRFKVSAFIEPGVVKKDPAYEDLLKFVEKEGAEHIYARRGMNILLDEMNGVSLAILFPDRDVPELDPNTGSVVAKLTYGKTSVILMGDAPSAIEKYLVALDGGALHADVLKVGHHGSKTSSDSYFLSAVSPSYAIISSGADNRYGHPHKEVLANLAAAKIPYLNTAQEGGVIFVSDGQSIWKK